MTETPAEGEILSLQHCMSYHEKGVPYEALPDIYLIFITKRDFFKMW